MKKLTQKVLILVVFMAVIMTGGGFANAGDINSNEAYVIKEASGTFVYEGVKYKAAKWAMDELKARLASDEYDLTAEEAQRAIIKMYDSIEEGVERGAIVPITKKTKNAAKIEEAKKEPYIIDSKKSVVTFLDKKDNAVLTADLPVKNVSENALNVERAYYSESIDFTDTILEITKTIKTCLYIMGALFVIGVILVIIIKKADLKLLAAVACVLGILILAVLIFPKVYYLADYITAEDILSEQVKIVKVEPQAELSIDSQKIDCQVFYGDSKDLLEEGAGIYLGSVKPGESGTVLLGGLKKYLGNIAKLRKYDNVSIAIGEEVFSYQVNRVMEAEPGIMTKEYLKALSNGEEMLVLYTASDDDELRTYAICDKIQNGLEIRETEDPEPEKEGFLQFENQDDINVDLWQKLAEMSYETEITRLYQRYGITEESDLDSLAQKAEKSTSDVNIEDAIEDIRLEIEALKMCYTSFTLSDEAESIRKENVTNSMKLVVGK